MKYLMLFGEIWIILVRKVVSWLFLGWLFSSISRLLAIYDKFNTITIPGSQKKKNLDRMFGKMFAHIEGKMGERG